MRGLTWSEAELPELQHMSADIRPVLWPAQTGLDLVQDQGIRVGLDVEEFTCLAHKD